jgi:hypothetical protein
VTRVTQGTVFSLSSDGCAGDAGDGDERCFGIGVDDLGKEKESGEDIQGEFGAFALGRIECGRGTF